MVVFRIFSKILSIFKDYCLNSSLAGLCYIADERYHYTERIFWLICITISSMGSYHLISEYYTTFESSAISMVIESLHPQDVTEFPSVAICEFGYGKQEYPRLEAIIERMADNEDVEYNYDVEDFLLRVIFQNLYNFGSLSPYCSMYEDCDDCIKCPLDGYQEFANIVRANCTELFQECKWNGKPFDCCKYFLPLKTTMGVCYIINSLQITEPGKSNWFNSTVDWKHNTGLMQLSLNYAVAITILNVEDIPNMILTSLQFIETHAGFEGTLRLNVQNIVNDDGVRDISPEYRKCLFPDEIPEKLSYRYHSFSTCVTECLKQAQIKHCNCTHYNMVMGEDDPSPSCNYEGLLCLDKNDLMHPQTTILQPWRTGGLVCKCLPSCNEHEIRIVEKTLRLNPDKKTRSIDISLQSLPTERYRRQAVRSKLDMVVSIGGILGLFMGASILSFVELVYFFTVRIIGNNVLKNNERDKPSLQKNSEMIP